MTTQPEPEQTALELNLTFSTEDLTFEEVAQLAEFQKLVKAKDFWPAWAAFYKVAVNRLPAPEQKAQLSATRWGDFSKVYQQFLAALRVGDQRRLAKASKEQNEIDTMKRTRTFAIDGGNMPDDKAELHRLADALNRAGMFVTHSDSASASVDRGADEDDGRDPPGGPVDD